MAKRISRKEQFVLKAKLRLPTDIDGRWMEYGLQASGEQQIEELAHNILSDIKSVREQMREQKDKHGEGGP